MQTQCSQQPLQQLSGTFLRYTLVTQAHQWHLLSRWSVKPQGARARAALRSEQADPMLHRVARTHATRACMAAWMLACERAAKLAASGMHNARTFNNLSSFID